MIQKVDNLKKGDLVVIDGSCISVFDSYKKDKNDVITVIFFKPLHYHNNGIWRRNCRSASHQIIYKITEDNLTSEQLNTYKGILVKLGINPIPDYLTLKNGDKIQTSKLYEYIEDNRKLDLVKEMFMSNDLGLKRNKEIADELFHKPDELVKEIFKNAIN